MASKLAAAPKLAQPFVRSKGGRSPLPPDPASELQGASSFALLVLAGSAMAGEDAARCPQSWGSFNSVKKGFLPNGVPGKYGSAGSGLVCCTRNTSHGPSSSCWGGCFWWVLMSMASCLQAPLSKSFHRVGCCCRRGSPCCAPPSWESLAGALDGGSGLGSPSLPGVSPRFASALQHMPCSRPGLAHADHAKAKLAEGCRATALWGSWGGLLHARHRDGSQVGCFNVTWPGTTAEFRPKSSSSFCKNCPS